MKNIEILKKHHDFIEASWHKYSARVMADIIGVAQTSYRQYIYKLGYRKQVHKKWTPEEVAFLRANYQTMGDVELAKHLDRNKKQVEKKRFYLKLKRTKQECYKIKSANAKEKGFGTGYGKPIGRRQKREIGEKWKYNGIWRIKLTDKRIIPLHEHIYRQHHQRIPRHHVLKMKDGNYDNLKIDNIIAVPAPSKSRKSKSHKNAMKLSYIERLAMGYTPEQTDKGTVFI